MGFTSVSRSSNGQSSFKQGRKGSRQARSPGDPLSPTSIRMTHLCNFFHYGWNKMAWITPCPLRHLQVGIKVMSIIKFLTRGPQLAAYRGEEESLPDSSQRIFVLIYSAVEVFTFRWSMDFSFCCSQEESKPMQKIILDIWCLGLNLTKPKSSRDFRFFLLTLTSVVDFWVDCLWACKA